MKNKHNNRFLRLFEIITEIIGWMQIMLSPTLIGGIIGAAIYFNYPSSLGMISGISIGALGLLVGIVWATRIFKSRKGTISFISRIMATPELDKEVEKH